MENLNGTASLTICWLLNNIPKKGITIVNENREKIIERTLQIRL
jgi:hypothetical protein